MKVCQSLVVGSLIFLPSVQDPSRPPVLRETAAITSPQGHSRTVELRPTDRLPGATGEARVERKGSSTDIEVEIRAMKPASLFGGDYNTYILWIVTPGQQMVNLGEF